MNDPADPMRKSPKHRASLRTPPNGRTRPRAGYRPVVLIVDDIPDNLMALEAMLQRDDIEIVTAGSGSEALEVLLEREVALAILDVQMPDMDGFELAALMRGVEKTTYIPIIFVTAGWRDEAGLFRGYEAGAVDYLFKPIDERILRSKVDVFVTLDRHRRELEELDRMREMFMAVLGHDLRSPLNGILLATQLLARRLDTEELNVQRIRESGQRMNRMITQLLDATRFRQDGTINLIPEPACMRALVDQIVSELDEGSERCALEHQGATSGTWDPDRMLQVLSNLIGNAARHGPAEERIAIRVDGREEHELRLRVHNGGPPIPDELRGTLFEPFRRASYERRRSEGLGLGLYITKQLVDAHGGTITFTSDARTGTQFSVVLPRHARS